MHISTVWIEDKSVWVFVSGHERERERERERDSVLLIVTNGPWLLEFVVRVNTDLINLFTCVGDIIKSDILSCKKLT